MIQQEHKPLTRAGIAKVLAKNYGSKTQVAKRAGYTLGAVTRWCKGDYKNSPEIESAARKIVAELQESRAK